MSKKLFLICSFIFFNSCLFGSNNTQTSLHNHLVEAAKLMELEKFKEAKEKFEKIVSCEINSNILIHAYMWLMKIYFFGLGVDQDNQKVKYYANLVINPKNLEISDELAQINTCFYLSEIYYEEDDYKKALEFTEICSRQDLHLYIKNHSFFRLGNIYFCGHGVPINFAKAEEYFRAVIKQKKSTRRIEALYSLGEIYMKGGYGIERNYTLSRICFSNIAIQPNDSIELFNSQFNLGEIYYRGLSVKPDYIKAKKFFDSAINQNLSLCAKFHSAYFLGQIYYFGLGVEINYNKARKFFNTALNGCCQLIKQDSKKYLEKLQMPDKF